MKQLFIYILFILCAVPHAWGGTLQEAVDEFMSNESLKHSSTGVSIVDLKSGKEIASGRSTVVNIPASVLKTVTCATAKSIYGGDFTFNTDVKLLGYKDSMGVFHGDIIVIGGDDPTLGSKSFKNHPDFIKEIVKALNNEFIVGIDGQIRVTPDCNEVKSVNPEWVIEDIVRDYGATSFKFNYKDNYVKIPMMISDNGVEIDSCSNNCGGLIVKNLSYLSKRGRFEPVMIRTLGSTDIIFRGALKPRRCSTRLNYYCSLPNPATYFAETLKTELKKNFIEFTESGAKSESTDTLNLLTFKSPSLNEIIKVTLFDSQNMYAETLFRLVGYKGKRLGELPDAAEVELNHWKGKGLDIDQIFLYDGSGLARRNKISAFFISKMLSEAYREMSDFPSLIPRVGEDGTVKSLMSDTDYSGQFVLKSGSMGEVQSFAGYYPAENPKYAISIIANNYSCSRKKLRKHIEDLLVEIASNEIDK